MTPKPDPEKCDSWIALNGEEYNCQWELGHLGCHSCWTNKGDEKLKWENLDRQRMIEEFLGCVPKKKDYRGNGSEWNSCIDELRRNMKGKGLI